MRAFLVPTIAALGLLAVPAFAQSNSASSSNSNSSGSSSSPPNASQIEKSLHQELSKAGYTSINIMPGSFLVHAKDSKGQMTEMMISPSSVTEVTAMNSSNDGSSSQSDSSGSSSNTPKK